MKNPIHLNPKNYAVTVTKFTAERLSVGSFLENGDIVLSSKYCPNGQYLLTTGAHFIFPHDSQMGVVQ
jgi:hypothetical protein